jgi:hypothetical protein
MKLGADAADMLPQINYTFHPRKSTTSLNFFPSQMLLDLLGKID